MDNNFELEKRIELLEFKVKLLFDNTSSSRLFFEMNVTEEQYEEIKNLMEEFRKLIDDSKDVHHGIFEERIYKIVPQCNSSFHFAENIARCFYEERRWKEVFIKLYGDMPQFQSYIKQ